MGRGRRRHGINKGAKANESSKAMQISQDKKGPREDEDPTNEAAGTPAKSSETVNDEEKQQNDINKRANDSSKLTQLSKDNKSPEESSVQNATPHLDERSHQGGHYFQQCFICSYSIASGYLLPTKAQSKVGR